MKKKKKDGRRSDVILLRDLAPRGEVKGGAGKRVFGASSGENGGQQKPAPGNKGTRRKTRS